MELDFEFDTDKLNRGFADINKATGIATRNTLDTMAALTRRNYIQNFKAELTERNSFTQRSIQFEKVSTDVISQMQSKAGALERAPHMRLQEEGGNRVTKSGANLAIATNKARGGRNAGLVSKSAYLRRIRRSSITSNSKKHYKSVRAKNVARAYMAEKLSKFLVRSGGIHTVSNFKKTGRNNVKFDMNMIYNTEHRSTKVKKTPMLEPATKKPIQDGQAIFNSQVNKLLRGKVI